MSAIKTRALRTADYFVRRYGFCNWQVHDVIRDRDTLEAALVATQAFWDQRRKELGELSPEAERLYEKVHIALITLEA